MEPAGMEHETNCDVSCHALKRAEQSVQGYISATNSIPFFSIALSVLIARNFLLLNVF
jgi:hypothetical protein